MYRNSIVSVFFFLKEIMQMLFSYGVPFVMTPEHKKEKILSHLSLKPGDKFLDLGGGDGSMLAAVSKRFSDAIVHGIENSPHAYKKALLNKKKLQGKYEIYKKDFFTQDFSSYQVIYSYTLPYLMKGIWEKVSAECQSGTLLYSSSFPVPNLEPTDMIHIKENNHIYIYKVQ